MITLPANNMRLYSTRRFLLPVASIFAAMLPPSLGLAALILGPAMGSTATSLEWQLVSEAFRVGCGVFGSAAVALAVVGLRRGGTERYAILFWIALGLGLGETLPIWWVVVELLFGVSVLIVGLFRGLGL